MRIFGAYQHFAWEEHNLTPALQSMGDLVRYDWHPPYDQYDEAWHYGGKQTMNRELLKRVIAAIDEAPLNVFYGYLCGRLVFRGLLEALRALSLPTLNMTLDDKTHRYSVYEPTGWAGMVDIASAFDLCWTSDPTALDWYADIGAKAIYLPAGANPDVYVPVERERDIDVLFVGKRYGRRAEIVDRLQGNGYCVTTRGAGWPDGPAATEETVELMNRAAITMGIGETAIPELLSLKGRDFEAPMCGALYLAQHNGELADHYTIGQHIDTWRDECELADKVGYYLTRPLEAEQIRRAAAEHSRRHHTWRHRFEAAFAAMGLPCASG